jgi:hypothetical protein
MKWPAVEAWADRTLCNGSTDARGMRGCMWLCIGRFQASVCCVFVMVAWATGGASCWSTALFD